MRPAERPVLHTEAVAAAEVGGTALTSADPTAEKDAWKRGASVPAVRAEEREAISEAPDNVDDAGALSKEGEDVNVSNEALRAVKDGEAMCTLEVLVKHTRERVGELRERRKWGDRGVFCVYRGRALCSWRWNFTVQ